MKKFVLFGFVVLLFLITACSSSKPTSAPAKPTEVQGSTSVTTLDGKALVEERCVECHDINRVTNARKNENLWKITLKEMIGKGAVLNEQEQQVVLEYLVANYSK